mgnify:CR=1 FL=1
MLTCNYKVHPKDVDFAGRMTVVALGDYILQTAGEDADSRGFGVRDLEKRDSTWVLSRFAIETERTMSEHESFSITTWVESLDRIFTTRHHEVRDSSGNVTARATTQWSVINRTTRSLVSIEWLDCATEPRDIGISRPRRLRLAPSYSLEERHRVRYSDIDFNGHTNTTRYIGWMLDMVGMEKLERRTVKRLDANFIKESRYGETLVLRLDETDDESVFAVVSDSPVMFASIAWE